MILINYSDCEKLNQNSNLYSYVYKSQLDILTYTWVLQDYIRHIHSRFYLQISSTFLDTQGVNYHPFISN